MHLITYWLTRGFTDVFRLIPFRILYVISDLLAFVLYRIVRYRRAVVLGNLRRCFPDMTPGETERIARDSYRNLADITMESLKGTTASLAEIRRRYAFVGVEVVNEALQSGRSVIVAGGHYNNWEWAPLTMAGPIDGHTIGVYKPLSNPYTDKWLHRARTRDGKMIMIEMKDTFRVVEQYKEYPSAFILVSDQSPSNTKTAIWTDFFAQDTACLPGVEALSRRYNYPVVYFEAQRIRRGYYQFSYELLCADPAAMAEGEITRMMMQRLEQTIRKDPAQWLWSHKRWKLSRSGASTN